MLRKTGHFTCHEQTRLAAEYLHRYASYYPGGIFWINATSDQIETEFWRVLRALNQQIPSLSEMREQRRDIREELEIALRQVREPTIFVIDNIPEADSTAREEDKKSPKNIGYYCPAIGAVTILATSRQRTHEEGVKELPVHELKNDASIVLLTRDIAGLATLRWAQWEEICEWVGNLPLALDLLNRCLALGSISPIELLETARTGADKDTARTEQLDKICLTLSGQIPQGSLRGVAETFSLSFNKLDVPQQRVAMILSYLAPTTIPIALISRLEKLVDGNARPALLSRHFLLSNEDGSFGTVHPLVADYLRGRSADSLPDMLKNAHKVVHDALTAELPYLTSSWQNVAYLLPHAKQVIDTISNKEIDFDFVPMAETVWSLARAQANYDLMIWVHKKIAEASERFLGKEHPETLRRLIDLAYSLGSVNPEEGWQLEEFVLTVRRSVLGEDHPDTLASLYDEAVRFAVRADYKRAQQACEHLTDILREDDPVAIRAWDLLSFICSIQSNYLGERSALERLVILKRRRSGDDLGVWGDFEVRIWEIRLAQAELLIAVNSDSCEPIAAAHKLIEVSERHVEATRKAFGEMSTVTLEARLELADKLAIASGDRTGMDRLGDARQLVQKILDTLIEHLGESYPLTIDALVRLAEIFRQQGDLSEARRLAERALNTCIETYGMNSPDTVRPMCALVNILRQQGELDEVQRFEEKVSTWTSRVPLFKTYLD